MKVIKRNGEVEDFNKAKVLNSLSNSGVSASASKTVVEKILEKNFDIVPTEKLYKLIYKLVKKYENKYSASIYSLKQAIMKLGPEGYAFEDFVAKLFIQRGELVEIRKIYESMSITHELDVAGRDFFIECKYRNKGGVNTPVKDVLYSHARFLDLKDAGEKNGSNNFKTFWIITNTKFSPDCIKYCEYWGINLMSWKYKGENSLSYLIDRNHLYPISLLPSLNNRIFQILKGGNILLLTELEKVSDSLLKSKGLNDAEIKMLRDDTDKIIKASKNIKKE